jgi:queuine/archaeosine tRNA-ribosyltransferase
VAPIVHGETALLPEAARLAAELLYPVLLAVPERTLGEGIVERTRTVRKIRAALNTLEVYCPLHLLGTGNPLSIIAYALAGADSFDGLEWCQTVVDHETGRLYHLQQWDLFRHQTEWGANNSLPYIQSVLMHNLDFYGRLMAELHDAIVGDGGNVFLRRFATEDQAALLFQAIEGAGSE